MLIDSIGSTSGMVVTTCFFKVARLLFLRKKLSNTKPVYARGGGGREGVSKLGYCNLSPKRPKMIGFWIFFGLNNLKFNQYSDEIETYVRSGLDQTKKRREF